MVVDCRTIFVAPVASLIADRKPVREVYVVAWLCKLPVYKQVSVASFDLHRVAVETTTQTSMEVRERKQEPTLKEKLKEKWNTRDFTPKEDHSNMFGMNFFFILYVSLLIECLFFLVPQVFPETRWITTLLTIFVFSETLINWHRSYFDTANYVKTETKEKYFPDKEDTPEDWTSCFKCQVNIDVYIYCHICVLTFMHARHTNGSWYVTLHASFKADQQKSFFSQFK